MSRKVGLGLALLLLCAIALFLPWGSGGARSPIEPAAPGTAVRGPAGPELDPHLDEGARAVAVDTLVQSGASTQLDSVGPALPEPRLRVLDDELAPLADARAWVEGEEEPQHADPTGLIVLDRAGMRALVASPGRELAELEVAPGLREVILRDDPGLELRVVWEADGTPVSGARISPCLHFSSFYAWLGDAWSRAVPRETLTDEAGRARVLGLRIRTMSANFRVDHPQAMSVLVRHPEMHTGELVLELSKTAAPPRYTFIDMAGAPIVGAPVTVRVDGEPMTGVTDSEGGFAPDAWIGTLRGCLSSPDPVGEVALDLGQGRRWLAALRPGDPSAPTDYQVDHRPLSGRFSRAAQPGELSIATAAALRPEQHGFGVRMGLGLEWSPVSGLEFREEQGWRGVPDTCVLVRAGGADHLVARVLASGLGALPIQLPNMCAIAIHLELGSARPEDWRLELEPEEDSPWKGHEGARGAKLELAALPAELSVPCARYRPVLTSSSASLYLAPLDASGAAAELRLPALPALRRITGVVEGTLSGPLRGVQVTSVWEGGSGELGTSNTDAQGGFEAIVPLLGPGELEVALPGDGFGLSGAPGRTAIPAQSEFVRIVREERRLVVEPHPGAATLGETYIVIHPYDLAAGRVRPGVEYRKLAPGRSAELLLPPGAYEVMQTLGDVPLWSEIVTLDQAGATLGARALTVALIALDLRVPSVAQGRLELTVTRTGDPAWVQRREIGVGNTSDPREPIVLLVPEGEYELHLAGVLSTGEGEGKPVDLHHVLLARQGERSDWSVTPP